MSAESALALKRLRGCSNDIALVAREIAERDVLIDQLHELRQDHSTTAAALICDAVVRLERLHDLFKESLNRG